MVRHWKRIAMYLHKVCRRHIIMAKPSARIYNKICSTIPYVQMWASRRKQFKQSDVYGPELHTTSTETACILFPLETTGVNTLCALKDALSSNCFTTMNVYLLQFWFTYAADAECDRIPIPSLQTTRLCWQTVSFGFLQMLRMLF